MAGCPSKVFAELPKRPSTPTSQPPLEATMENWAAVDSIDYESSLARKVGTASPPPSLLEQFHQGLQQRAPSMAEGPKKRRIAGEAATDDEIPRQHLSALRLLDGLCSDSAETRALLMDAVVDRTDPHMTLATCSDHYLANFPPRLPRSERYV